MQAWVSYYATIGPAAAALLGLLFVSVSINAGAALGAHDSLTRGLTEQAFQNYLAVMLVALLALFPSLDSRTFGLVCLLAVVGRGAWIGVRLAHAVRHRGRRAPLTFALRRYFASTVGFVMLLSATVRMALGQPDEQNLLAAATLVLLFSATAVSWELLRRLANPLSPVA